MYNARDSSTHSSNPEMLQPCFEVGDSSELEDLLRGMVELSSACGGYSATQFATEALEEMKRRGIEVNPFSMRQILKQSFGNPEELFKRMQGKTPEELDEMLPGKIGDAAVDYLKPVLGQE